MHILWQMAKTAPHARRYRGMSMYCMAVRDR
jgi:hypothetical protein